MKTGENPFLARQSLLRGESELRSRTLSKQDVFKSKDARRHFNEGFVCRHYMLQSSRLFLGECTRQDRKEPLSPYEATDCAIHVNAYYLNLRGALDNLAWTLQYEWQLLPKVSEDVPSRKQCGLFARAFRMALKSRSSSLASLLEQQTDWARELADLRDPAAHRVPIYVPPAIMTSQDQVDEFRRIGAQASMPASERGDRSISEIYQEAQAVGEFAPVMIISNREGLQIRYIDDQIGSDHVKYLIVAGAVVDLL